MTPRLKSSPAKPALLLAAVIPIFPAGSHTLDIAVNGFIQGDYSAGIGWKNSDGGDYKLVEERFQLRFDASHESLRFFIVADGIMDRIRSFSFIRGFPYTRCHFRGARSTA